MEKKQDIIKALIKFQAEVPPIELNAEVSVKTKSGGTYKFRYADLPHIAETIQPTLTACELLLHFEICDSSIVLHVIHTTGQELTSSLPITLKESAQENGSLITYYKRYLITSALNITAEQDDDANISAGNKASVSNKKVALTEKSKHWDYTSEKYAKGEIDLKTIKGKYTVSKEIETLLTMMLETSIDNAAKDK